MDWLILEWIGVLRVCVCVSGSNEIPPTQSEFAADTDRSFEPNREGASCTLWGISGQASQNQYHFQIK